MLFSCCFFLSLSVSLLLPSLHPSVLHLVLLLQDHFQWTFPHQCRWMSVRPAESVPQSEQWCKVVVEEQVVVRVVGRAVDERSEEAGQTIVAVVDGDGPDVYKGIKSEEQTFV